MNVHAAESTGNCFAGAEKAAADKAFASDPENPGLARDLASQDAAQAIINVANLLAWMKLPKLIELTDGRHSRRSSRCLLYTSDAADE